jgi:hypothetical protein
MPSDPDFVATGPSSSMFYTSYSRIMRRLDIVMEGQNLIDQLAHCIYPFDVMMEGQNLRDQSVHCIYPNHDMLWETREIADTMLEHTHQ